MSDVTAEEREGLEAVIYKAQGCIVPSARVAANAVIAVGWRPQRAEPPATAWRLIGTEPPAITVLACRWDDCEWAYAVVETPLSYPFTHWSPLPTPPSTAREEAGR